MNKQEACDLLQSLRDQVDALCEQIDQDDDPGQNMSEILCTQA